MITRDDHHEVGQAAGSRQAPHVPNILSARRRRSVPAVPEGIGERAKRIAAVTIHPAAVARNDRHASYDEAAAKLARRRTIDFFDTHLG